MPVESARASSVVSVLTSSAASGAIGVSYAGTGGGATGVAATRGAAASSASSRARNASIWLSALRAKINATMAITSAKNSNIGR